MLMEKGMFTTKEANAAGISGPLLHYYVKKGEIERVRRGTYRSTKSKKKSSFKWHDLIEAVQSTPNGVVCLISALEIYELTDEVARQYWIAIEHTTTFKASKHYCVMRFRNTDLGKTVINLDGYELSIFDRERTIIDAFRLLSKEIAIKSLKYALEKNSINLRKLRRYAKKLRINIDPYVMSLTT